MISEIDIYADPYTHVASIGRPEGDIDQEDLAWIRVPEFGLTSGGVLYWDTNGASPGECPIVFFDEVAGTLIFDTGPT